MSGFIGFFDATLTTKIKILGDTSILFLEADKKSRLYDNT
jgi:hypothetical protein